MILIIIIFPFSMISPKYHQILQQKMTKNDMRSLAKQVQHSRVAVESITKFNACDSKFKEKIDVLQNQLQFSITSINVQNKRNKVLNQLIAILKGEMFKYQKTKKKQQEAQQAKMEKLINKCQYQVDQILQKHNEEIAKINNLKDLANSGRSQRVVYSSLFKKLQKQIKYYQQLYKQQLIISQYVKSKPSTSIISQNKAINLTRQTKQYSQQQKKKVNEVSLNNTNANSNEQFRFSAPVQANKHQGAWNGFITMNKQQSSSSVKNPNMSPTHKKFHPTSQQNNKQQRCQFKASFYKQQKLLYTKQLLKKITQFTNLIQKVKIYSQSSSTDEIIEHYSIVQRENKELLAKIADCDRRIEAVVDDSSKIRRQIKLEEFISQQSNSTQKLIDGNAANQLSKKDSQTAKSLQNHLLKISQICQIPLSAQQAQSQNKFPQQFLKALDQKISLIHKQTSKPLLRRYESCQREETLYSEALVDNILQKMDRFGNCEKILDRGLLQQEYYKEIGKKKSYKFRKEASR